ncbi:MULTISPECIES: ATP-dependent DNA helicase RecG [unclassified Marinitoga]|uniref:ATP-dependent DNA helicase RecG n=1 Tax=unclassified Marinitoga TaxID=2640159 RepID=UPI000640D8AE|nr:MULTISPECIES: ATP-dependent DNA helicase RecG [unclassified Marinitoga]KLO24643.1 ATP-dependent DNA helicase RecG [Marinitoga sp. 1155]NUU98818.1 ATP-dependent DNA helicase RecG [Marinitoga sp. 1154]
MFLEDFFKELEKYLKRGLNKEISWNTFFPEIYRFCENNINIIEKEKGLKEKIGSFLAYYKPINKLSEERRIRRIKEGFNLIEKLKNMYLIDTPAFPHKELPLKTDIKFIKGVGNKRATLMRELGINNIEDTFYFFPREYEDRREIKCILDCYHGQNCLIVGNIVNYEEKKVGTLRILSYVLEDKNNSIIILTWFNQEYIKKFLNIGMKVAVYGTLEIDFGRKQMKNPDFQVITSIDEIKTGIMPIYPLKKGLYQNTMRNIFSETIQYANNVKEFIPEKLLKKYKFLNFPSRIKGIHFPKSFYHLKKAKDTLRYEEIFLFELSVLIQKLKIQLKKGFSKKINGELSKKFMESLPFKLTNSQIKVFEEIRKDMKKDVPMNRLLQGDVGSGKTVVSELALIDNFESGFQGAVMVPTSVLAKQQYKRLKKDFEKFGINVEILLGETKKSKKIEIKENLIKNKIDILIGTHALIQDDVEFKKLGLVVIDEQHRFGVRQRLALISKGKMPDILFMTATPIPRTLAMTLYGDLDVSIITEMPAGRKKIKTLLLKENKVNEIYKFIDKELESGNQAFFVYPLIDESEVMELKAATEMYDILKERFREYEVGLLHGKMTPLEKNDIMEKFINKEFRILVSTTVIEVGMDIPDATIMVIEHADRFGLSQLHQLRGRVGRSKKQAYCFLIMSQNVSAETKEKLRLFANTTNGFEVSEIDLKWRGPGKFFGTEQHGLPDFKFLDILKDTELIEKARKDALEILKEDPELKKYKTLKYEIYRRYGKKLRMLEA